MIRFLRFEKNTTLLYQQKLPITIFTYMLSYITLVVQLITLEHYN